MSEAKKRSPYQRVSDENMERIVIIGKYGESFDDVLGRLLDVYEDVTNCIKSHEGNQIMKPQTDEIKELMRRALSTGYHDVEEFYKD